MAFLSMACTNESSNTGYINISRTSYTFNGNGKDSCVINVESDTEWEMEVHDEWISATRAGGDSVIIKASANETESIRSGSVAFRSKNASCEMIVDQTPKSFTGKMINFPLTARGAISPNGKYAAYLNSTINMETSEYTYYGVKINLETMEETSIPALRSDMTQYYYINIQAISDDGRTIILGNEGNMEFAVMVDGEFIEMPLPEGYRNPAYQNMSADGSVIIGFAQLVDDNWNPYRPIAWRNGDAEILEVPEVNATGQSLGMGVMARACSSDGSVIYGSEWDYNSTVYWKDGQMHYPGLEYAEVVSDWGDCSRPIIMGERFNLSHDGRYLVQMYLTSDPSGNKSYSAAYVDTETGELKIFDSGVSPITVRNDGLAFCGNSNFQMTGGMVMNLNTGEAVSSSEWFKSEYGINIANTFIVQQVGENGNMAGVRAIITGLGITYRPFYIVPE